MCPIVNYCIMHAMFSVSTVLHHNLMCVHMDGALRITTHDITILSLMATCNLACTDRVMNVKSKQ